MNFRAFKGSSKNGNIHEAIADAISKAKNSFPSDFVEWKLENVSGQNGGFVLQNLIEVEILASPIPSPRAYFECVDADEKIFVIELTEERKIEHARRVLSGEEELKIHISGTIIKKPTWYNPQWSYHLKPSSIDFFEFAIEVCDSTVAYVEDHLDEVGGSFLPGNHWCPWTSKLVREIDLSVNNPS